MKRLILITLSLLFMSGLAMAEPASISCKNVVAGEIPISGTVTSYPLTLSRDEGYFSVQAVFTGGVMKIDYQVSNDGATWSPAVQIVASATTGTVYPYPAAGVNIFAKYQRLVITETGASTALTTTGVYQCSQ